MQPLFRIGTLIAAWIGSIIGLVLVLPLGLIVVEWLIFPLALAIAALLAALSAGWAGSFLARDQTQTHLLPVIAVTSVTAVIIALIFLTLTLLGIPFLAPLIIPALIWSLILAFCASLAVWRFRRPEQGLRSDIKLTLALLLLAVISVPGIIFLASLFGLAGA